MIRVTRLNGEEFVINAEVIKYLEEMPDTVITLVTNEKLIVKEKVDEIKGASQDKVLVYMLAGVFCLVILKKMKVL